VYIDIPILPVDEERCWRELIKNVYWVDWRIEEVDRAGVEQDVLRIKYAGEAVPPTVVEAVRRVSTEIVKLHQRVPVEVMFSHRECKASRGDDPVQQLVESGSVRCTRRGSLEASGLFLRVMRGLDRELSRFAARLGAEEFAFPSLLPFDVARQCGILDNQPQHIDFITNIQYHIDGIRQFRSALEQAKPDMKWTDQLASPRMILSPAVCYHYWSCAGQRYSSATDVDVGTATGRCYRFEVPSLIGLERLREFTMREVFGVGLPERTRDLRRRFLDYLMALMARLDLAGRIESASDPFFVDIYAKKRMFQLNMRLKHEMLLWLPYKREVIAVASVNDHRDFFTKGFGLATIDGAGPHSCCMAFGLERLALAVLAQHGLESANWPSELATLVSM
jgi:seryl-tRNA synthetase